MLVTTLSVVTSSATGARKTYNERGPTPMAELLSIAMMGAMAAVMSVGQGVVAVNGQIDNGGKPSVVRLIYESVAGDERKVVDCALSQHTVGLPQSTVSWYQFLSSLGWS